MSEAQSAAAHAAHVAHVAHEAHVTRVTVKAAPKAALAATYSGSSSFQACVIARESGGNAQVMNSSGHYGLYQFSYATWVAYGGSPALFGHASVAGAEPGVQQRDRRGRPVQLGALRRLLISGGTPRAANGAA